ncbi:hypothetical protein JYU34_003537 [Plutella xylostella]|uniref:Uncharacterized protein n=1 Tax=Plutella xylostella TaxID=51655 RepID=A0ABQ7R0B3_PLUXY|nr:protein takeout [Plutella xylostella]KAG7310729.1 hypothetical protein JYU34_003537 [Plutella xylostella]
MLVKQLTLTKVLSVLVLLANCHGRIEIEKYLKTCDRNSPDVNDCLLEAITEGLTLMCDGIPDLGLPPIDPYEQDDIKVEYKRNQISAKMYMKDIVVAGLRQAKVLDARLRADEERFHLEVDMTSPSVFVTGRYHGEGRYNSLRVNATGGFNTTMRDLVYTWKLDGKPLKRDGETFVKIHSFYMRPDVGDLQAYASDIFPDNPQLTELANQITNQNWRIMYRELLPYAQANWNLTGVKIANKIFLKVPYDQLFPASS